MKKTRLIKNITTTILIFLIGSSNILPLSAATDNEKDRLFEELEKIKNEQLLYSQNIIAFQNESNAAMLNLDQTKELVIRNKREIERLEESIIKLQKEIKEKKEIRGNLIRKLYINNPAEQTLIAFISSANLNDLIKRQIQIKKVQEKVLIQIKNINEAEEKLEEEKELAILKRENLFAQIDLLENQLVQLKTSIEQAESRIKDLEKNRKEIEQQILALQVAEEPQNVKEIINWNIVNFTKQDNITFYGSGTPHGVGMSQYGAKAMAKAGKNYEEILTHYYQGTHLETINTNEVSIKIKLSTNPLGGNIIVRNGPAIKYFGNSQENLNDGAVVQARAGLKLVPSSASTRFEVTYKYNKFKLYRGEIEIKNTYAGLLTINKVNIEDYLRSVISGEMSHTWPIEALKAQAVAARNYAYKNIKPSYLYDLCDTPSCQVYLGAAYEFPSTNKAISETAGKILKYENEIITAYYFSTSGGWTENNENVWGGTPKPYLRGVASPGEESRYNSWQTKTFTKAEIQNFLNNDPDTYVGNLQKIEITKRGVSGRIMAIKITGSAGEKLVTGRTFKYVININLPNNTTNYIKSTLFGIK